MPRRVVPISSLKTYTKKFVTPRQLADYSGVPRRTVYHHIDKGALAVHHIGGAVYIRIDVARKYVGE
jgi:excisionase family DNA binding protein